MLDCSCTTEGLNCKAYICEKWNTREQSSKLETRLDDLMMQWTLEYSPHGQVKYYRLVETPFLSLVQYC